MERHSFIHLVGFLFCKGGSLCHHWGGYHLAVRMLCPALLVDPAISNVDRNAEPMGEIAGSAS